MADWTRKLRIFAHSVPYLCETDTKFVVPCEKFGRLSRLISDNFFDITWKGCLYLFLKYF